MKMQKKYHIARYYRDGDRDDDDLADPEASDDDPDHD